MSYIISTTTADELQCICRYHTRQGKLWGLMSTEVHLRRDRARLAGEGYNKRDNGGSIIWQQEKQPTLNDAYDVLTRIALSLEKLASTNTFSHHRSRSRT